MLGQKGLWGVFVGTFIHVLVIYILDTTNIVQLLGDGVGSHGNLELSTIWLTTVYHVVFLVGIIQVSLSIIAFWRYRLSGIVVSLAGFAGWSLLIFSITDLNAMNLVIGTILVLVAGVVAIIHGRRN